MNEEIEIQPFREQKILVIIEIIAVVCGAILLCLDTESDFYSYIPFLTLMIMMMYGIKHAIDLIKIKFVFSRDGLEILNFKRKKQLYFSYDTFNYAYYWRTYRHHRCLILTREMIPKKNVKKMADKFEKIFLKNGIVIYLNLITEKDLIWIEEIIKENIPNVKKYRWY